MTERSPHVGFVYGTVELADGFAWVTQDDGHPVRVSLELDQRTAVRRGQPGVYVGKWIAERCGLLWVDERR